MDAIALLKEDHDNAKKLMSELEQNDRARRQDTRGEVDQAPQGADDPREHRGGVFYPALHEHPKLKDIVLEALEEHHLVDEIVEQLKDTPFDDEHWSAKFKVT